MTNNYNIKVVKDKQNYNCLSYKNIYDFYCTTNSVLLSFSTH